MSLPVIGYIVLAYCYLALADAYQAPSWACSPAPKTLNPLCPAPARGDSRCSASSCPADAGCATANCNAVQGKINADQTLVLDAWYQRGATCIKSTWTLSECCSLCSSTAGCNAWSYCNNPAGCGADCAADLHDFQFSRGLNLWSINPTDYPSRLNPEHKCLKGGKWPYNTCSLKVVAADADVKAPPLVKGSESSGWVSGVLGPAGSPSEVDSNTAVTDQADPVVAVDKTVPATAEQEQQQQQQQQQEQEQEQEQQQQVASPDAPPATVAEATPGTAVLSAVNETTTAAGITASLVNQPHKQQEQHHQQQQQQQGQQPQPKLVNNRELDTTVADVLASNPQSRHRPQGPVSNPTIVPSTLEDVLTPAQKSSPVVDLEVGASDLNTFTNQSNTTRINHSKATQKAVHEPANVTPPTGAAARSGAKAAGRSAAVLLGAAVGSVALLASLV